MRALLDIEYLLHARLFGTWKQCQSRSGGGVWDWGVGKTVGDLTLATEDVVCWGKGIRGNDGKQKRGFLGFLAGRDSLMSGLTGYRFRGSYLWIALPSWLLYASEQICWILHNHQQEIKLF